MSSAPPSRPSRSTTPAAGAGPAQQPKNGQPPPQGVEMKEMGAGGPEQEQGRRIPIEEDLMQLARLGEIKAIQKLFDAGTYDANSSDEQGITALHVCPCVQRILRFSLMQASNQAAIRVPSRECLRSLAELMLTDCANSGQRSITTTPFAIFLSSLVQT